MPSTNQRLLNTTAVTSSRYISEASEIYSHEPLVIRCLMQGIYICMQDTDVRGIAVSITFNVPMVHLQAAKPLVNQAWLGSSIDALHL